MGIEERLERLEKQNRRMKLVGGGVLLVMAGDNSLRNDLEPVVPVENRRGLSSRSTPPLGSVDLPSGGSNLMPLSSELAERSGRSHFSQKTQKQGKIKLGNTVKDYNFSFFGDSGENWR